MVYVMNEIQFKVALMARKHRFWQTGFL